MTVVTESRAAVSRTGTPTSASNCVILTALTRDPLGRTGSPLFASPRTIVRTVSAVRSSADRSQPASKAALDRRTIEPRRGVQFARFVCYPVRQLLSRVRAVRLVCGCVRRNPTRERERDLFRGPEPSTPQRVVEGLLFAFDEQTCIHPRLAWRCRLVGHRTRLE